jgi:hypothetical protein
MEPQKEADITFCPALPEIPPCPLEKGRRGGFLAPMGLIHNAAFDHVNLLGNKDVRGIVQILIHISEVSHAGQ